MGADWEGFGLRERERVGETEGERDADRDVERERDTDTGRRDEGGGFLGWRGPVWFGQCARRRGSALRRWRASALPPGG